MNIEKAYLNFLLSGIFYNMVMCPYLSENYTQILIRIIIIYVLFHNLVLHIINVIKQNNLDEIPLNERERNIQFMNRVFRILGHN